MAFVESRRKIKRYLNGRTASTSLFVVEGFDRLEREMKSLYQVEIRNPENKVVFVEAATADDDGMLKLFKSFVQAMNDFRVPGRMIVPEKNVRLLNFNFD